MLAAFILSAGVAKAAEQNTNSQEVVPLVVIDDVPLIDAIKNIARQMQLNYIVDPRVPGSGYGLGRRLPQPAVNSRWTDVPLQIVMSNVLASHKLTMVTSPATGVTRITPAYRAAQPVPASQVGTNAGVIIPVLNIQEASLSEAIRILAETAHLNVSLDPKVRATPTFDTDGTVSIRWEQITARQALAALLDNYDLILIEDSVSSSSRITLKTREMKP